MKKSIVFILIFFLFFSIYFKLAKADTAGCHVYIDGVCQTWIHWDTTAGYVEETIEAPYEIMRETASTSTQFSSQFLTLAFQFFSIVILFILLIVLLEGVLESK